MGYTIIAPLQTLTLCAEKHQDQGDLGPNSAQNTTGTSITNNRYASPRKKTYLWLKLLFFLVE